MSDNEKKNNRISSNLKTFWYLDESLDAFHKSLGATSVYNIREELRKFLSALSEGTLAHLLLLDGLGGISCALLSSPNLSDDEKELAT